MTPVKLVINAPAYEALLKRYAQVLKDAAAARRFMSSHFVKAEPIPRNLLRR